MLRPSRLVPSQNPSPQNPSQLFNQTPKRAGDAELADQQEIIVRRLLPINHLHPDSGLSSLGRACCPQRAAIARAARTLSASTGERAGVRCRISLHHGNGNPFFQQPIHLAVRRFQAHSRTVAGQFIHGGGDGLGRQGGIRPLQRRSRRPGKVDARENRAPLGPYSRATTVS